MEKKCKVEGCERVVTTRGYCGKHYCTLRNQGFFDKEIKGKKNRVCFIDGCDKKYYGKGYCKMHYQKYYTHGDANYKPEGFHGMTNTSEYTTWAGIKQRCYNEKAKGYKNWGGRGITVCDRWKDSFINFLEDMGIKPDVKMQIDRINNEGNYEPSNCEWVTHTENCQNTRSTVLSIEKAREIRTKHKQGIRNCDIARYYNCNSSIIAGVIKNNIWKEVVEI